MAVSASSELMRIIDHSLSVGISVLAPAPQIEPPQIAPPLTNSVSALPVVSVSATMSELPGAR